MAMKEHCHNVPTESQVQKKRVLPRGNFEFFFLNKNFELILWPVCFRSVSMCTYRFMLCIFIISVRYHIFAILWHSVKLLLSLVEERVRISLDVFQVLEGKRICVDIQCCRRPEILFCLVLTYLSLLLLRSERNIWRERRGEGRSYWALSANFHWNLFIFVRHK